MYFRKHGEWNRVVRITGPSHNLLGIVFVDGRAPSDVIVESLPTSQKVQQQLLAEEVQKHVLAGVAEGNAESGAHYAVAKIQFVPTDSPPASVYRMLARSMVQRLAKGEAFTETPR
jgi:hypothetical protein